MVLDVNTQLWKKIKNESELGDLKICFWKC